MAIPPDYEAALDTFVDKLTKNLRDNLYSAVLYGSAVRGNLVKKVSDLNVVIILNESGLSGFPNKTRGSSGVCRG